jgi:hypothetical protein
MCVEITREVKQTNRVRFAWKVISSDSTKNTWLPLAREGSFKRGAWVKAEHYYYGFNCYALKQSAIVEWEPAPKQLVRVRIRKVQGYGNDGPHRVIFAREIFVPKGR